MEKIAKATVILIALLFISSQFITYSFDFLTDQLAGINALNNKVESELVNARVESELAVLEAEKDYKISSSRAKSVFYQSLYFFGSLLVIVSTLCFVGYTVLLLLDKGHERVANIQGRAPMVTLTARPTRALIGDEEASLGDGDKKQLTDNREAYRVG